MRKKPVTNLADSSDLSPIELFSFNLRRDDVARLKVTLAVIISVSLTIHVVCLLLGKTLFVDARWPHLPVHAAVEMAGGLIALWVAWILLTLHRRGNGTSFNVWIAGALIGMGLLDGLHAMVHEGPTFVWLHSMATFVGGVLFATVWLPRKWQNRIIVWWPWAVATSALLFGIVSLALPDRLPQMLIRNEQGKLVFTMWAQGLNVIGGVLLFSAAARMILIWRKLKNVDDLLFILQCLVLGAAAVMFEQSQLWDLPWWGWHILRLLAYGVALWFVVLSEQRGSAELRRRAVEMSQLSAIVEATDDAIIGKQLDGTITSWNHGAERLYGYTANEMIGQPIVRIIPPDRQDEVRRLLDQMRLDQSVKRIETVRIHKNGTKLDVGLSISPVCDRSGNIVAAATIARNIVEHKQIEQLQKQLLEQSRAELEFAYASAGSIEVDDEASDIINVTGTGKSGTESFDHAMSLWARQARKIIGAHQSAVSFIPHGNFAEGRHAVSMSEKYDKYNSYNVPPTGEGIWALVAVKKLSFCLTDDELKRHSAFKHFSNLRGERGLEHPPLRGWLAVPVLCHDHKFLGIVQLSDKYSGEFTENDLQRLTRLAQLLAPAFSLHIANEEMQLRGAELAKKNFELDEQRQNAVALAEELKKADKAKNEFLANMSHEIRTPMNAVVGLTEMVLHSSLNDIQRDYLKTVMDSAESLLSVINDILDFSKIEAGMLHFEKVDFQLNDIVGDTARAQALRAASKSLELACFVDPEIPETLVGDPGRLRQVLTNLVGNAIKFTSSGKVVVRVEQESRQDGDVHLQFTVRDSGIGIPIEKLESIFLPFEQVDMSSTRKFGGTGLGLTICQRLVSLMGGCLDVDSKLGQGSTFRFTAGFRVSEKPKPPALAPPELRGIRVLIVDDKATNRTILEQAVLAREMAPVTAESAADAFNLLREASREGNPFRLLISDVHMPHIDGFMLAEMIRADPELAETAIIQLTSTGLSGDQQRCSDLRIAAQLAKPVKQPELYSVIIRTLGMQQRQEGGWLSIHEVKSGELPSLRILLVEDSVVNQKVAMALLGKSGHTIVVANNGREALDVIAIEDFDLILMDIQMPVLDGMETTAAIRASEAGSDRHQPIIAMTAHAMSGDRERCLAAGMDEYVSKPVRREVLDRAIAVVLGLPQPASISAPADVTSDSTRNLADWNAALAQLGGDLPGLKEITESYIEEILLNLPRLRDAIAAGNARESKRLAHTVKGAMRFFHSEAAMQAGIELESQAGTGDLTSAPELFERFKSEVERVLPVLRRFIDTGEMR